MSNARFSIIPAWAVVDPRLKGADLRVLGLLGSFTNKEGWCRRSQVKMADELSCGRSTVQASINRLCEIGIVEKRVVESPDGRDSAHWYRVVLDRAVSDALMAAWSDGDDEENDPISPASAVTPPATIVAPPAGPGMAPPATSGPAPINDSNLTIPLNEGERARARDDGETKEDRATIPGTAEFRKRLQCFLSGHGYRQGEWPNWANGATIDWIMKHFAALPEPDRQAAEANRDAFLLKSGKTNVMGAGNYFKGRAWEILSDKDRRAGTPKSASDKPDNWAKAYGPAHAAMLFRLLRSGPDHLHLAPPNGGMWLASRLKSAWPRLVAFWQQTDLQGGVVAQAQDIDGSTPMEFVTTESSLMARWKAELHARNLPDLRIPDGMGGHYFPRGGPQGWFDDEDAMEAEGDGSAA